MTKESKRARSKLNLLELGDYLNNVWEFVVGSEEQH